MMLPNDLAIFLNFLGIPWINVDEDKVREIAAHTREFVAEVQGTLGSAGDRITSMESDYSGYSYQQLLKTWGQMSTGHREALETGGTVVAFALEQAADIIEALKIVAIAELTALTAALGVSLAASGGTMTPFVAAAGRKIVSALQQTIVQYVFAQLIEKAITAFEEEIAEAMSAGRKWAFDTTADALGVDTSPSETFRMNPDEVLRHADALIDLGDDIDRHHARFVDKLSNIDFGSDFGELVDPLQTVHPPPATSGIGPQAADPTRAAPAAQTPQGPADGRTTTEPTADQAAKASQQQQGSSPQGSAPGLDQLRAPDGGPTSTDERRSRWADTPPAAAAPVGHPVAPTTAELQGGEAQVPAAAGHDRVATAPGDSAQLAKGGLVETDSPKESLGESLAPSQAPAGASGAGGRGGGSRRRGAKSVKGEASSGVVDKLEVDGVTEPKATPWSKSVATEAAEVAAATVSAPQVTAPVVAPPPDSVDKLPDKAAEAGTPWRNK